jgi:hypothetical protein
MVAVAFLYEPEFDDKASEGQVAKVSFREENEIPDT